MTWAESQDRQRRGRRRWIAILLGLIVSLGGVTRAAGTPTEYEVKATFLFHFVQFVTWPAAAFATPNSPLIVGVLGDDPFGDVLDGVLAGESVAGRPLVARRYADPAAAGEAHLLFVGGASAGRLQPTLDGLAPRPVLTVGEVEDFCARGGMINFIVQDNRVRFQVNKTRLDQAGLTMHSRLLNLAIPAGNDAATEY